MSGRIRNGSVMDPMRLLSIDCSRSANRVVVLADNPRGIINWYQCWNNSIWRSEPGLRSIIGCDGEAPEAARRAEGGAVTLLRDGAVKRIALARDAGERANDALHLNRPHCFPMSRSG